MEGAAFMTEEPRLKLLMFGLKLQSRPELPFILSIFSVMCSVVETVVGSL